LKSRRTFRFESRSGDFLFKIAECTNVPEHIFNEKSPEIGQKWTFPTTEIGAIISRGVLANPKKRLKTKEQISQVIDQHAKLRL